MDLIVYLILLHQLGAEKAGFIKVLVRPAAVAVVMVEMPPE
jgi:hypothetical protein